MSEAIREETPGRQIAIGNEQLSMRLSECGLMIWLEFSDWPHRFPLCAGREKDWAAFKSAVDEIRSEALQRARITNAVQDLLDPIDGPNGEA